MTGSTADFPPCPQLWARNTGFNLSQNDSPRKRQLGWQGIDLALWIPSYC